MIRTNLIKRESAGKSRARKWLVPSLTIILLIQLLLSYVNYTNACSQKDQFNAANQKLETLKQNIEKLQPEENLQELAGMVAARNNWFVDRRNNPLGSLAKLQKDCPNNVRFLSYSADLTSGKIVLTAPDLNSVSSWLNSHFSSKGNISVMGKENNLLMIQFVWSS